MKLKVRILDGRKQIHHPEYGWMTWNGSQWRNNRGFANFPHPDRIDFDSVRDISIGDLVKLIDAEQIDGGEYREV